MGYHLLPYAKSIYLQVKLLAAISTNANAFDKPTRCKLCFEKHPSELTKNQKREIKNIKIACQSCEHAY